METDAQDAPADAERIVRSSPDPGAPDTATGSPSSDAAALLGALSRLDRVLERAVSFMTDNLDRDPRNRLLGLYLTDEDVIRDLARPPAEGPLVGAARPETAETDAPNVNSRLDVLSRAFGLTPFEVNALLIAIAPDVDLRYERTYAFLQDDLARLRPTVELALDLLCHSVGEKLESLAHFGPEGALRLYELIELVGEPTRPEPALMGRMFRVEPQVSAFLLGVDGLDERIIDGARLVDGDAYLDDLGLDRAVTDRLMRLVAHSHDRGHPLRLHLHGGSHGLRAATATAIAAELGVLTLEVDGRVLTSSGDPEGFLRVSLRQAWFDDALLVLHHWDALLGQLGEADVEALASRIAADPGGFVLLGDRPWVPAAEPVLSPPSVAVPIPGSDARRRVWHDAATEAGVSLEDADVEGLARRHRLTPAQVRDTVARSAELQSFAGGDDRDAWEVGDVLPVLDELARSHSGHELANLTLRVEPRRTLDDIVVPDRTREQLVEICRRVAHRGRVLDEWGWRAASTLGTGTSALFSGPSGTGKTLAAEIVAQEVGHSLFRIDLASVVDKYIGETEKNLDRIFTAAENVQGVLLFDEADAVFGKRAGVKDARDRYANIEISYLLQRIEQFEGLAILSTNLPQNIDEAFIRRLAFVVRFPTPAQDARRGIWRRVFPKAVPLAPDVDLDALATDHQLTGGSIRNAALAASYEAAATNGIVTAALLERAVAYEYERRGKELS